MKKATTVDEQVSLLVKRGMLMDLSLRETNEVLLDIGYYRLGSYWHPFGSNSCHQDYGSVELPA